MLEATMHALRISADYHCTTRWDDQLLDTLRQERDALKEQLQVGRGALPSFMRFCDAGEPAA